MTVTELILIFNSAANTRKTDILIFGPSQTNTLPITYCTSSAMSSDWSAIAGMSAATQK